MKKTQNEYYYLSKDSWQDWDREHFIILNALDRCNRLVLERYSSYRQFGLQNGDSLNHMYHTMNYIFNTNLKGLTKICKALDVSYQWALFGTGEMKFKVHQRTFKNLKKTWDEFYEGRKSFLISSAICQAVRGKTKAVPLKYLIRVARECNKDVDWLLGG